MTSTTESNGRFCNQVIRNLAVSLIAKRFDLHVTYANGDAMTKLGLCLYVGTKVYDSSITLTDDNYFTVFFADELLANLNPNMHYFQSQHITNLLYSYLRCVHIMINIIAHNPYQARYNNNNDLLVHVRLTDVAHHNAGVGYYLNTIRAISFDTLYITTDDPNHEIIHQIRHEHPSAMMLLTDEVETIQFASTCRHLVLSHGSFSAVIGYFAFFSTVNYPKHDPMKLWYGDMFSITGWIERPVSYIKDTM